MRAYFLALIFLYALPLEGQPDPVHVPGKVLRGSAAGACPSDQDTTDAKDELRHNISAILADRTRENSTNLNTSCGGPGWRRVGYLDMTDPSQSCPSGLALKNYSQGLRSCGRATSNTGCWSTFYNTGGSQYSRVCGRVRGYQFGTTSAFYGANEQNAGFESFYVDGVSLTHGQSGSRTHIWTFTGGLSEVYNGQITQSYCPCVTAAAPPPPSFVGNDYFCESGLHTVWTHQYVFFPDDPLWDGRNCVSSCCWFNNPPYFTKTLPAPTTDNMELRICSHTTAPRDDTPIDQVELFVQ